MHDRYGAVIPAYNEQEKLPSVLKSAKRYIPARNIVVVDDGSTDETARTAEREGVQVIRHRHNMGKGASLRTGFDRLITTPGIEAIFTLDADGQHDPDEMPSLIEKFEAEKPDVLIGNRMGGTQIMPRLRLWTNRVTSAIISRRTGHTIEDSQCGYRVLRSSLLRRIDLRTSHYETESELLIKAGKVNAVILSVPIVTIYAGEVSAIHPLRDTLRFFLLVIRSLFW
jgi:glycosyltransferase involved in cell wall biosynthesis